MIIKCLVENTTDKESFITTHGLSLYIETDNHKILFDVGPDNSIFLNAEKMNVDIEKVDTVIISHGHYDHGGALKTFIEKNKQAKIYIQEIAFGNHYSKKDYGMKYIGLDKDLLSSNRIILVNNDHIIDDELSLFTVLNGDKFHSCINDSLYDDFGNDKFDHEQNLLIKGKENVLIIGCGHKGIINILEKGLNYNPKYVIGGYHLYKRDGDTTAPDKTLNDICIELKKDKYKDITFYTCHCTGIKAYNYFCSNLNTKTRTIMNYLACGDEINI